MRLLTWKRSEETSWKRCLSAVDDSDRTVTLPDAMREILCVTRVRRNDACVSIRIGDDVTTQGTRVDVARRSKLTHDVNPQQDFQFHGCSCRSSSSTCLTRSVCDPRSSSIVVASNASLRMSSERHLSARLLCFSLALSVPIRAALQQQPA